MTLLVVLLLGFQQQAVRDDQCIACHEDQALEAKGSMHEKAAVGCVSCHGTDEIVNEKHKRTAAFRPARAHQVASVCGACHAGAAAAYKRSPHAELPRGDEIDPKHRTVCSACHEYHTTPVPTRKAMIKTCLKCHEEGTHEMNGAEDAYKDLDALDAANDKLDAHLRKARRGAGLRIFDLEESLQEVRSAQKKGRVDQHALEWRPLKADAVAATGVAAAAYNTLAAREESFARRFFGLGLFLVLLGFSAILVARRARTLQGASGV